MEIKRTFRLIKRNPIMALIASIISISIIAVVAIGLLWLPISIYSLHTLKDLISNASGMRPDIKRFKMNILTGEYSFSSMVIFNSQKFDIQNYKSDSVYAKNAKTEMMKIESMKLKLSPFSIFAKKPVVEQLHVKISSINAMRITPKTFNILMFINNISESFSAKKGMLNKVSIEIVKNEKAPVNVSYLDFSSSKDVISIEKNEVFNYSRNEPENVEKILREISDEISKKTSMLFLSKAINSSLDK